MQIIKTVPKEAVKEMLLIGALDKDMHLTDEEGAKRSFKEALMTLKNSEELNAQPSHTPVIKPVKPEEIDPEKETVKSLSEILDKWMTEDGKFKDQVIKANTVNSNMISTNEVAMLRKHFDF